MKIIVFCVLAGIITVLSVNVYNSHNPYKRWIFQRRIPLYSYKINLIDNGNLSGQSNAVLMTKNSTGLYNTDNQNYKSSQTQDTRLNVDGKITDLRNEDKTLEEDAVNANLIRQSYLKKISSDAGYADILPLSGLERQHYLKLSHAPYIPNYLTYYYGNNNRNVPVNYYGSNRKGGYSYGLFKNDRLNLTDVVDTEEGTQDINIGGQTHYSYNTYLDNNNERDTNSEENNRIDHMITAEVNTLKEGTKESPSSVTLEESQEDDNDKTRIDTGSAETKEMGSHNTSKVEEDGAFKTMPCLASLVPLIPTGIKRTNNINMGRNNLLGTRVGDAYTKQEIPIHNRGVCVHKCVTICN